MKSKRQLLIALFIYLLFLMQGKQLFSAFQHNIANTIVYKSFGQSNVDAVSRQHAMAIAATSLGESLRGFSNEPGAAGDLPMIPASLRGLYYHRLGDWKNAANWYGIAAQGEPAPKQQQQILISPWMEITSSGDFELPASSKGWRIRTDTPPGATISITDGGQLDFSCSGIREEPKKAFLEWSAPFVIPYHHTLVLRAKVEPGTLFNFETVIDGQFIRHLTHRGTGNWQDFVIPVEGHRVRFIYIVIREDPQASSKSCRAKIGTISFQLDEHNK